MEQKSLKTVFLCSKCLVIWRFFSWWLVILGTAWWWCFWLFFGGDMEIFCWWFGDWRGGLPPPYTVKTYFCSMVRSLDNISQKCTWIYQVQYLAWSAGKVRSLYTRNTIFSLNIWLFLITSIMLLADLSRIFQLSNFVINPKIAKCLFESILRQINPWRQRLWLEIQTPAQKQRLENVKCKICKVFVSRITENLAIKLENIFN